MPSFLLNQRIDHLDIQLYFQKLQEEDDTSLTESLKEIVCLIPDSTSIPWLQEVPADDDESEEQTSEEEDRDSEKEHKENEKQDVESKSDKTNTNSDKDTSEEERRKAFEQTEDFISFDDSKQENVPIITGIADLIASAPLNHKLSKLTKRKRKNKGRITTKRMKIEYEEANVGRMVPRPNKAN